MKRSWQGAALAAAGLSLTLVGCAATARIDPGAPAPRPAPAARIEGAFVPAGRSIEVALDRTIASDWSAPGQRFTARVMAPVFADDGSVLIHEGARLYGHVADVDRWRRPSVRLSFDTIETRYGPVAIDASMLSERSFRVDAEAAREGELDYDVTVIPGERPRPPAGAPAFGYRAPPRPEVRLPAGTEMRLVLKHPLLAPGARIHPR
jgi:hypothetical protein